MLAEGFAAMLASLSEQRSIPRDEASDRNNLVVAVQALIAGLEDDQNAAGSAGFMGASASAAGQEPGAEAPVSLAAIFNEFGLFGQASPELALTATPANTDRAAHRDAPADFGPMATAGSRAVAVGPAAIAPGSLQDWSPEPRFSPGSLPTRIREFATSSPRANAPLMRAASVDGRARPASPSHFASAAATRSEAPEFKAGEAPSVGVASPLDRGAGEPSGSGGDLAPFVRLSVAERGANLVARLDRLGREDRVRLRQEAERLLAAFGLAPAEIRINGAVDSTRRA